MKKDKLSSRILPFLLVGFIVMLWFTGAGAGSSNRIATETFSATQFASHVEKGDLTKVVFVPKGSVTEATGTFDNAGVDTPFTTKLTSGPLVDDTIRQLQDKGIEVNVKPENTLFLTFLMNILPFMLLMFVLYMVFRKTLAAQNKSMDFSDSKERLIDKKDAVTFDSVAGCDEEKSELVELVDYLRNPKKYDAMGARIPKGVLLVGPPGNGKTLLARAVAGEASVPFYSISGSEFIEMFVGVGASRVRKLFQKVKRSAPAIIFIDEIDAVGRQRGGSSNGSDREGDQTLNQILVELDGLEGNSGVIIIAATNRADVLDPALLRPGRFDRQIKVSLPNVQGRIEILKVHAKNKKVDENIDFESLAKRTIGFSGAELENLLNEAAILAVRQNRKIITIDLIDEAIDRVMMGPAKTSRKYSDREKRLVAYHEAGHAVVGLVLKDSDEVQKVTIVPRGDAGGYNLFTPKEENYFTTETQYREKISGFLGGRAAEQIVFEEVSSGAYGDLKSVTQIARTMVTKLGMSALGNIQFDKTSIFYRNPDGNVGDYSEQIAFQIDDAVKKIVDDAYSVAHKIITEHRDLLDNIANALIEYETLNHEDIQEIFLTGKFTKKVIEHEFVDHQKLQDDKDKQAVLDAAKAAIQTDVSKENQVDVNGSAQANQVQTQTSTSTDTKVSTEEESTSESDDSTKIL